MVELIKKDLKVNLKAAPPTLVQIINGKLWVRVYGDGDEGLKCVFTLQKAPRQPKGFACILADDYWPTKYWEMVLDLPSL